MIEQDHSSYMERAIELAKFGLYSTMPNPRVGCVVVKNGIIIGEGWHEQTGRTHAEINALGQAGKGALGATAYVTLEPCSHIGKTAPCCDALINAGVRSVVYSMQDPDPRVAGRGLKKMRSSGIEVVGPVLEEKAQALNPGFSKRMETGRPWVRCKMAMSLDGRTAMASGESKWITGQASRLDVQRLRARSCAVVTGIGSILIDDPYLGVREGDLDAEIAGAIIIKQPLRVVLDSNQRLRPGAKVLQPPARSLIVSTLTQPDTSIISSDVEQISLPRVNGMIDLLALVEELGRRQCNEVLVEAGASLAGAFLKQGLLDELIVYIAPKLLGNNGKPLFYLPLQEMIEQVPLTLVDIRRFEEDVRITTRFSS